MFTWKSTKWLLVVTALGMALISGCSLAVSAPAGTPSDDERDAKLKVMSQTAADMFQLAKAGKFPEARERLLQFTNQMTNVTYQHITSVEGLNALTELVTEARGIYAQVRFSPEQGLLVAAKLMLAADALAHREAPLWLNYRKVFKEDASALRAAIKEKDNFKSTKAIQDFHRHYLVIRPAVLISRNPALAAKLDSWFVFMQGLITENKVDYEKAGIGARQTDDLIAELFDGEERAATGAPADDGQPLLWSAVLLAAIVAVLAYVGWKKYTYTGG